ncbi:MAG: STELLO glycosyltransferase family protein [Alphaproteobacteria bacterium]
MSASQRSDAALVVTSISPPNAVLRALAMGAAAAGIPFHVVGDRKSPPDFALEDCRFHDLAAQAATGFRYAAAAPVGHYARKNVGYLLAIREGATVILETDDDNIPTDAFFAETSRRVDAAAVREAGWVNVYAYFADGPMWPRGLPLDAVANPPPPRERLAVESVDCPIQQGLADDNPDVDAIYRLILPLPVRFRDLPPVALGPGAACPFNSQNTRWWAPAFPLLYLPAHCSFRMTDIWRSFVAQRIAWANGWHVLFHAPTVRQERNAHDLMRDFADEVPGYLHNRGLMAALGAIDVDPGPAAIAGAMRRCYGALVAAGAVGAAELPLLDAWLDDLAAIGAA